ncbi:MAG: hypothetical protein ACYTGC_13205 [Planctomycetota bacterium]
MRKAACIGIAVLALLLGPNAFWLARSTVRIENRSSAPVPSVVLAACSLELDLGTLSAGSSVLRVLPQCGDDTLVVSSGDAEVCRLYVEGSLYHVRAWFSSPDEGDCGYGSPPFSPLLVLQLL